MSKKNIVRFSFATVFILFLCLYIGQAAGYYETSSYKKNVLTEEAIKRFEADVKNGKQIEAKNYLEQEKVYSNSLNKIGLKTSKAIETVFDKAMGYLFREINKVVSEK